MSRKLSDGEISRLANEEPGRLVNMIGDGSLDDASLTFAAERAGLLPSSRMPLITLLNHASAVVREGAVYGLTYQLEGDDEIATLLRIVARDDQSPGVRAAAAEALS